MIKNLKPGCLTKFVITIDIGEYENILAVFLERKCDKRKIDILPNKYINEAIQNIIIYEDSLRRTLYI